jgi:hypothetical protein
MDKVLLVVVVWFILAVFAWLFVYAATRNDIDD